ncbi:MAG: transposase [Candidatus Midichloriaceae bacterium]|jgi:transposase|nr:transposase [Candidatus Midichloriaceae bacterium]
MTYSIQFRKKVLKLQEEGESFVKLSERFKISTTTITRWKKQLAPKVRRYKRPSKIDDMLLKQDILDYPDSYIHERAKKLGVSKSGVHDAMKRLGVSYKKTLNHPKAAPEKRSMFCQRIDELQKEGKSIAYIDESGFAHDMPRTHGYSIKGQRCYGKHDWGAKGRTNAIGALIGSALVAIGLLSGSVNTEVFTCWVEHLLLPDIPEQSVVVMGNATFHKGQLMQKLIADSGHTLLYLPPYSPDLNPYYYP